MKDIKLFKINETLTYRFYKMPKELFENPYYKYNLNLESTNKIFNEDNILEELSKLNNYEQKLQNLLNKHY